MVVELESRGKTVETEDDATNMQCRWLRLEIQKELEKALEVWLASHDDVLVDLDVDYSFQEPERKSLGQETEAEAAKLQEASCQGVVDEQGTAEAEIYEPEWDSQTWEEAEWCWNNSARVRRNAASTEPRADNADATLGASADSLAVDHDVAAPVEVEIKGKPLLDPPEFGDRVCDTGREPFWIPGAFPTIFQNQTGDPYNAPEGGRYRDMGASRSSFQGVVCSGAYDIHVLVDEYGAAQEGLECKEVVRS